MDKKRKSLLFKILSYLLIVVIAVLCLIFFTEPLDYDNHDEHDHGAIKIICV